MFGLYRRPHSIDELKVHSALNIELKRNLVRTLIIDDQEFFYETNLRSLGYDIVLVNQLDRIEMVEAYDIILCDIHGVGITFNEKFQGAYLAKEIKRRYPFKVVIIYSSSNYDVSYNEYIKHADFILKKDAEVEKWQEFLDESLKMLQDPILTWRRIRDYLLARDMPLFDLSMIESEFVERVLKNKSFEGFPSTKKAIIPEDVKDMLIKFSVSTAVKLITSSLA